MSGRKRRLRGLLKFPVVKLAEVVVLVAFFKFVKIIPELVFLLTVSSVFSEARTGRRSRYIG